LLALRSIETKGARIEIQERKSTSRIRWHFNQPSVSLFWYGAGFRDATYSLGKSRRRFGLADRSTLCLVPTDVEVKAEFEIEPGHHQHHVAVFLDPALVKERLGSALSTPIIGFNNERLTRSLGEFCREAEARDAAFPLFAESWMYETLAHLTRMSGQGDPSATPRAGGLSARRIRLLDEFIHAHHAAPITLAGLSELVGLSSRQLLRAFQQSHGVTPHQYVLRVRLDEARRLLLCTEDSITSIALQCGFSHGQHFSAAFRRATGHSPMAFRRTQIR
jgi:AraC family transcriptional regulator